MDAENELVRDCKRIRAICKDLVTVLFTSKMEMFEDRDPIPSLLRKVLEIKFA